MKLMNKTNLLLNKYTILEPKGKGGFANVYLSEDQTNNKFYAVKVMNEYTSTFQKELKMLQKASSINNPYIIKLVDFGEGPIQIGNKVENKQFAVLEYAPKGELYDYLEKTKNGLEERHAKFIFRKILQGVQAIHNLGICHRDLKLENILLDESFNPKICDFGFATEIQGKDGYELLTNFVGTLNYAAPQMFSGKPYNGIKADIFSLGVILLNLATGKIGFIRAIKDDKYYKFIMNHHYKLYWDSVKGKICEISEELKSLYLKMVSYNEEKRPSIEEILKDPWMKEINDLNEMEYKLLEKEVYQEFALLDKLLNNNINNND